MSTPRVVVIGAGIGGLAAAVDLARRGAAVTVLERAATPGGKMREVHPAGRAVDAGPTVFTMRWVFDALFEDAGASLVESLDLVAADVLARHAWTAGGRLDLYADLDRSVDEIGRFAGADAARLYREFCARSADVHRTLRDTYIAAQRPSMFDLVRRVGFANLSALWRTAPYATLWQALARHFRDPRLRQLFARYATYVGASPLAAPATLMLIAHVEREGVWIVRGGMHRVARAIEALGARHGVSYRYGTHVASIDVERGRATGVTLAGGERLEADAIVHAGDAGALAAGLLGDGAAPATRGWTARERSLSAITWCTSARTRGFPLDHHNVFFADDYPREFESIFARRTICDAPTVYVCAQDRGPATAFDGAARPHDGTAPSLDGSAAERLLVLVNAPADGDSRPTSPAELDAVRSRAFGVMRSCGLELDAEPDATIATTPDGFDALFPGSGGALYGRANHGPFGSFRRPGSTSRIPGLYLAGGTVHPGAGVPMAAMSGRLAAERVFEDLARRR
jgi:1-hydroxycarotenoid 3,4-desaturase